MTQQWYCLRGHRNEATESEWDGPLDLKCNRCVDVLPASRRTPTPKPRQYRKKPIVVTAIQTEIALKVQTKEGEMAAKPGDWIVTGVQGEKYPVDDHIFRLTYDLVENPDGSRDESA